MDAALPKCKKRKRLWVLVVGFIIVGLGVWLFSSVDRVQEGDAGYRRLLKYSKLESSLALVNSGLPLAFQKPLGFIGQQLDQRMAQQFEKLCASGYLSTITVMATNLPVSLLSSPKDLAGGVMQLQILQLAPDSRYVGFYSYFHDTTHSVSFQLTCRTRDVPIYKEAFGSSNSVEVGLYKPE